MRLAFAVVFLTPLAGLCAQDKVDFGKQIAPILVQRCIECHGPEKDKGDLRLDLRELAFPEDDQDAWVILPGEPEESELVYRITLPDGHDEIMPEKGEPLSKAQQELFRRWITDGAEWPETGDQAIAAAMASVEVPKITFELPVIDDAGRGAIERAMEQLRDKGAVVQRVAADTEAIDVNLSLLRDKITDADLALLVPLAPRLVWLNVSRTAITDAGGAHLGKLTQLRRLHAANTGIGDEAVKQLTGLSQLEFVNFYGTEITDEALPQLATLPQLKKLHAWQTKVTKAGVEAIRDHFAKVEVDLGDYAEERMAAAAKEIAEREAKKEAEKAAAEKAAAEKEAADKAAAGGAPVNDICPVTGEPIDPEQTVVHDGRVIAFCCKKCRAAFGKDPAKYQDKLPPKGDAPVAKTPINDTCPVSGEAVDAEFTVVHDGRLVGFCCGKCKAAFGKDPKKYESKLPKK